MTVFWPSLLLYNQPPSTLLRSARSGNLNALDSLLRLDKRVLTDRRVSWHVARILAGNRRGPRSIIETALTGRPSVSVKPAALKAQFAAFMIEFSALIARDEEGTKKLTTVDARKLLDAVSRDQSGQPDLDLPQGDDAWYRAVKRARKTVQELVAGMLNRTKPAPPVSG